MNVHVDAIVTKINHRIQQKVAFWQYVFQQQVAQSQMKEHGTVDLLVQNATKASTL